MAVETTEVRIKNERTGGEKGQKLERYDLIPWRELDEVARVYGTGAQKYAERNWEKGYSWGLSAGALGRHLSKWMSGERRDEMGNHHLACIAFHCLALMQYERTHPELNDIHSQQSVDKND